MVPTFLPGEVLAMSAQAADRLLKLDSGDAALLYLHLLRRGGLEGLKWPEDRVQSALERLRGRCIQEVKKTAGSITFKDAVRYQRGE